jgi:hypothetical protein
MMRRIAITQAEFARAIRAAKREGAQRVEVKPDGSVVIHIASDQEPEDLDVEGKIET